MAKHASEPGSSSPPHDADVEKMPPAYDDKDAHGAERRGSAVADIIQGEMFDGKYETTQRGLKSRHAQMIALGGTIGTGLFVGSGQTLARGGPAFIVGCFVLMSILIFCIVSAIAEVAAYLPTVGSSMNIFGFRYVSRSLGFAMGYLYFYSLGILVPYEITAAALVIEYWEPPVHIAVWITIMIVVIVGLNALPVKFYGETEFWFASTKIIMMVGLLMVSFILFWGGGPSRDRLGFRYWRNPGPVNTYLEEGDLGRFLALLSCFVLSAFPFAFAPELLVATGGEMKSPRRNIPIAARRYIYRLIIFYIGSVLAISVIVRSDDPTLTSGGAGAGSSPFTIGMKNAGIPVLDSIVNGGIIISAWSSGNSFLYLSSRSLYSLALSGNAPAWFKACTKSGVPYRAVAISSIFCALAYLNAANDSSVVFNWFVNLTNTSGFISWICCCIVYLRFRKACIAQGITDIPYHSWIQPYGAYFALVMFSFLLLINGFNTFWDFNAASFFTAYVGIPLFLIFFVGHRIYAWGDPWAHDPHVVDMTTGLAQLLAEEQPPKTGKRPWYMFITYLWT